MFLLKKCHILKHYEVIYLDDHAESSTAGVIHGCEIITEKGKRSMLGSEPFAFFSY